MFSENPQFLYGETSVFGDIPLFLAHILILSQFYWDSSILDSILMFDHLTSDN